MKREVVTIRLIDIPESACSTNRDVRIIQNLEASGVYLLHGETRNEFGFVSV